MKLSLVITTFNRTDFVIEAFVQVLDNPAIDEIIVVDDFSDVDIYEKLLVLVNNLKNEKVKLFRNDKNLGPLLNKYEAVKRCNNEWIIMLDSDNIINNDYVEKVLALNKDEDMLYCPEVLQGVKGKKSIGWDYTIFRGLIVDKTNVVSHIDENLFETWLNTGNYFFYKKTYISNIENSVLEPMLSLSDSIYFSYLWLLNGNRMKIVPRLDYVHRVHNGSWYKNHLEVCGSATLEIKKRIKNMKMLSIIKGTDESFSPYYDMIPKLIRERNYKQGIEVGVFAGGHAKAILENSDLKLLIGIDPYEMYDKGGRPGGMDTQEDFDRLYSLVIDRLKSDRYIHFKLTSDAAFASISLAWNKFDFIFIDGLHTYEQVKKDLYNYSRLIRKGGIIACHDYNHTSYPEVSKAIDEFVKQHNAEIVICPLYAIYMEKTWE